MTESPFQIEKSDLSKLNTGKIKIFCAICNRITEQNYLGLEVYSRRVASRCAICNYTNFDKNDLGYKKNPNKNDPKNSVKEIEKEKIKIFGPPKESNAVDDLKEELETFFSFSSSE